MEAGRLRERVAFDARQNVPDGAGNFEEGWREALAPVAAAIKFLKGSEPVVAQRLQGVSPVVITIRASRATRAVTTAMRARDVRSGRTFNVTAVTPDEAGQWIDLLCVAGGADG